MSVRLREDLAAAATFMMLPLMVYHFLWWVGGHETLGADYAPSQPGHQLLFMQTIRDGFWPLWAPGDSGGIPFAAYFLTQQYSPVTWLMMLFDASFNGLQVEMLTFLRIGLLGMSGFATYLLARRLSLSAIAGVLAGVIYVFNLRMLDCFRYGSALDTVVWLPVLLLIVERLLDRPRIGWVAVYAGVQHLMIVAGHTQKAFYCIAFVNAWFIVRAWTASPDWAWRIGRALRFAAGQALGLCLSAVMLIPILMEFVPLWTNRVGSTERYWYEHQMTWPDVLYNFIAPWLANVHSVFYCALPVWLLAALGTLLALAAGHVTDRRQRRLMLFLALTFVICLLYSLGPLTPVGPLVNALPMVKSFRGPGRVMTVGTFAMALLAAWALDMVLIRGAGSRIARYVLGGGCALCLLAGGALLGAWATGTVSWGELEFKQATLSLPVIGEVALYAAARIRGEPWLIPLMGAVMVAAAIALGAVGWLWQQRYVSARAVGVAVVLLTVLEAGVYHRYGTWTIPGRYYTAPSGRSRAADVYHTRVFQPSPFFMYSGKNMARPAIDGQIQIAFESPGPAKELLTRGGAPGWRIYYQNVPAYELPRAYLTPRAQIVHGNDLDAIARLNPYAACVIDASDPVNGDVEAQLGVLGNASKHEGPESTGRAARNAFTALNRDVRLVTYTPNRAAFAVHTDAAGVFNYSDGWSRGWKATLDGRPVQIYRANHAFKAISMPAGQHLVEFTYDPSTFRAGLIVSLTAGCVVVALLLCGWTHGSGRSMAVAMVVALACVPAAVGAYRGVYRMAFRTAVVNYDPTSSRPAAVDLDVYLHEARS